MERSSNNYPLPQLLSTLGNWKESGSSTAPIANTQAVDLMSTLLLRGDYVSVAEQMSQDSDAKTLLDFILHLLHSDCLSRRDAFVDMNRRARRFMFKVVSKLPVIPASLIVDGVIMPTERDYIGGGGFGRVFKGELRGKVVALKVLYKSDNQVAFCREALMWRSLKHKFVLPFLGIHEISDGTAPQFFLVSPYMKNGTLAQWRKQGKPSIAEIEERILEVARGVEYIHAEGAVHGDLRGENILLDDDLHVQIADFGLTRLSEATNTRTGALHLNFAAPELFVSSEDDEEVPARTQMSDVYAFGCVYYEIHYDSVPFAGKKDIQILTLVSRGTLPLRLDEPPLSDRAWEVIQCCWARDVSERPTMSDVMESLMDISQSASLLTDTISLTASEQPSGARAQGYNTIAFPEPDDLNADAISFLNKQEYHLAKWVNRCRYETQELLPKEPPPLSTSGVVSQTLSLNTPNRPRPFERKRKYHDPDHSTTSNKVPRTSSPPSQHQYRYRLSDQLIRTRHSTHGSPSSVTLSRSPPVRLRLPELGATSPPEVSPTSDSSSSPSEIQSLVDYVTLPKDQSPYM